MKCQLLNQDQGIVELKITLDSLTVIGAGREMSPL